MRGFRFIFDVSFLISLSGQMSSLEHDGEEVVGQARCPFESRQSNVGLFAGELSPATRGGGREISYNLTSARMTFYKAQKAAARQQ